MAVVAGVVFFAVRALLALIPALAAGAPIKKWSACAKLFFSCHTKLARKEAFSDEP
jgi:hypothetical protein